MTNEERDAQFDVVFSGKEELIPARDSKPGIGGEASRRVYNRTNESFWEKIELARELREAKKLAKSDLGFVFPEEIEGIEDGEMEEGSMQDLLECE